jgi:hypothetical protein
MIIHTNVHTEIPAPGSRHAVTKEETILKPRAENVILKGTERKAGGGKTLIQDSADTGHGE